MSAIVLDSPFFHVYVFELWSLADSVIKKCSQVFEQCPAPDKDGYIKIDPLIHSLIASLLNDAANVKKLLTVPTKQNFKETSDQFKFRTERTKLLNEVLKFPSLVELSKVEARNSLEHFDEYLDRANLSFSSTKHAEQGIALYNMVLSSWRVFDKKAYPLKLYVAEERKYYNLEMIADISALNTECSDIITRIRNIPAFGKHEGPGGLMIPVK